MIKPNISNLKALAGTIKVSIVKHSPEILMGVGTLSFVGTIITASRATIKAQDILEEHKEQLDDIKLASAINDPGYTDEDARKDKITVYTQTSLELVKRYAPSLGFAAVTLTCFFGAFSIMRKRYAVLAAAYSALEESFRLYRERVIADKGPEADLYYLTGSKPKEITVKDEDGNKTKKKVFNLPDGTIVASPYAFKFGKYKESGELNKQWKGNPNLDRAYVLGQIEYLNDRLYWRSVFNSKGEVIKRGSVFLNEMRDLLGEDPTTAGAVVGNRYGNGEPGCNGYIGDDASNPLSNFLIETTDEYGDCFIINPNVDGLIYDLVDKFEEHPFVPAHEPWSEDWAVY